MTAQKFSAKEAAAKLGTDARTLRKFIRSSDDFEAVGQGNRYEFTSQQIKALEKKFKVTVTKTEKPKSPKKKKQAPIEDAATDDEVQDEVDRTTEEVDLDDDDEVIDLEEIDLEDDDL